jgi:3-mercaptopyruvate sulfurtransferase SseA
VFKTLIDPSTLASRLGDPNWVIIDCRFDLTNPDKGEELYRESHIPGARYAHLDRHLVSEPVIVALLLHAKAVFHHPEREAEIPQGPPRDHPERD